MKKKKVVCFFSELNHLNKYRNAFLNIADDDRTRSNITKKKSMHIETEDEIYEMIVITDIEKILGYNADLIKIDKTLPIWILDYLVPVVGGMENITFIDLGEEKI